jgi:hypothetical protein
VACGNVGVIMGGGINTGIFEHQLLQAFAQSRADLVCGAGLR